MKYFSILFLVFGINALSSQDSHYSLVDRYAQELESTIIGLRRNFHQFPELSNREFETSKKIAEIMTNMGFQVETGVAKTGVVALLDTGRPGPTVALRADIDGLPVTEVPNVGFASKQRSTYNGEEVGVMHACGHDMHTAMLIGSANIIKRMSGELNGRVVFIFQPAEEGPPPGEEGGAKLMVKEGVLEKYNVDVIFGQHVRSMVDVGTIRYKVGGMMASANRFVIKIKGKPSHGSAPWSSVDPITVSSQVIIGLQTIVSRQMDISKEPVVISVGMINGGVRHNIIPEEVEMVGTIRTLDPEMQAEVHERIRRVVNNIAESAGATAEIEIGEGIPVVMNNPELTRKMLPSLYATVGENNVIVSKAVTIAEDFSYFAQEVPGLYLLLGAKPKEMSVIDASQHHTPDFYIDEKAIVPGMKAMANLAIDYLKTHSKEK